MMTASNNQIPLEDHSIPKFKLDMLIQLSLSQNAILLFSSHPG